MCEPGIEKEFQSLSGLTLGLNDIHLLYILMKMGKFQSLSGLTLGLNANVLIMKVSTTRFVSIPFRADTGFELCVFKNGIKEAYLFQSLSGLTLGLNKSRGHISSLRGICFNPFQG